MTAKLKNLDETLPTVPADPPRVRTTATGNRPTTPRPNRRTAAEREMDSVIGDAARRLVKVADRQTKSVRGFATASLYRLTSSRLSLAQHAKDPEQEITDLQKALSLLIWELGNVLEDLELSASATTIEGTK